MYQAEGVFSDAESERSTTPASIMGRAVASSPDSVLSRHCSMPEQEARGDHPLEVSIPEDKGTAIPMIGWDSTRDNLMFPPEDG